MGGEEEAYVKKAFDTNWIAPLGPNVDAFEKTVAEYTGIEHALALNSGTAAIHLALEVLGVRQGDTVFCSSLTFVASANPICYLGAKPVFIDSEPNTWNMCPDALEKAFLDASKQKKLPKAVIVVNLYGQSADYEKIKPLCDKYNVPILEDAAESLGASFNQQKSGSFGKLSLFSFNGNKIISTSGGGMLLSNDKALIDRARFLSTQAKEPCDYYQHHVTGYNYRLSNVLAGIGLGQMGVLDSHAEKRRAIFQRYNEALQTIPAIQWMSEPEGYFATRWLSVMLLEDSSKVTPENIIAACREQNIEARHVWKPLHLQPVFKDCQYYTAHNDIAKTFFERGVCLPSGSSMSIDEQQRVIDTIRTLF